MVAERYLQLAKFLAQAVMAGLAAAFVVVLLNPGLLGERQPPEDSFATAVAATAPSVANIYTTRLAPGSNGGLGEDPFFRDTPAGGRRPGSLGSGVVVSDDGYIITNHHVIAGATQIFAQLADGRVGEARVVGTDPETDLALLQVNLTPLPVMPLGRSDTLRRGDVVLAIGNPFGLSHSVTQGVVSATGRGQLGVTIFENFIQTDAAINLGNSGGALVNTRGELVGINTAMLTPQFEREGINFAIPVNLVRGVMQQLVEHGRVMRGQLGVSSLALTPQRANVLGLAGIAGIELIDVFPDSPAERAGLLPGDIITSVNGRGVRLPADARNLVAAVTPGNTVDIEYIRGGLEFRVEARVDERVPQSLQ